MPVPISGLPSVSDRTLYTRRGPIVKKPVPLLSGTDLYIVSDNEVVIPTGSFGPSTIGKTITIVGSPSGRNDGTFLVKDVRNSTRLVLEGASFDYLDVLPTEMSVVALANDLKSVLNSHLAAAGDPPAVHGNQDLVNTITVPNAVDLASAIILLKKIRQSLTDHIVKVGPSPSVHTVPDLENTVYYPDPTGLGEAILLANELRIRYEAHRDHLSWHEVRDVVNRVTVPLVSPIRGSGPLVGPMSWTLSDPRWGQIADSPSDVVVKVNGSPVPVDAVFGLLGAVVLASKPAPTDTVTIDYSWIDDPPLQFERLNSPEFNLNQTPGRGLSGYPGHRYRSRSTLIDPTDPRTVRSPAGPLSIGWKYKGLERAYTASLNDPNSLLTNVPNNKVAYPVLSTSVYETVIRYDPTSLPNESTDPWTLQGTGTFSLAPGGGELTVVDSNPHTGPGENPPFFSHKADFTFPSTVSSAFRVRITEWVSDGSFTGVGFGLADGPKVALVGFLETQANNLSSAVALANALRAAYDAHLSLTGVHRPNDLSDAVDVVNANDLTSLIILLNRMKSMYNSHIAKGSGTVHVTADSINSITSPDAVDLDTAISLANELASKFNSHRTATGVHYVDDSVNKVGPVRQVGILTSRGFPEHESSWNCGAVDWTETTTYRLYRDVDGNMSLYVSGGITPIATADHADLPAASDLDIRIDPVQQIFFGAVWREATSSSGWAFIRTNITPVDSNQIADNKSVLYDVSVVPELDQDAPWITIGQGGTERILTGPPPRLMLDSTSSVPLSTSGLLGFTTGEYRGFLRSEPILSVSTTSAIEFLASVSYWTFSLDNKSSGVFIDDGTLSVHFVFLQHMPSPATITGTSTQPFSIAAFDTAILSIGNAQSIQIVFPAPVTTAAAAAAVINAAVGFVFATDDGSGRVKLTDSTLGASSKITLIGGAALEKLGLNPGTYFGRDSNPEPKVSWFGESLPDADVISWTVSGGQQSSMYGRTLRITDSSVSDFRSYTQSDSFYTAPVLGPSFDWKVDARLAVLSYTPGDQVMSGTNLRFAGSILNIDEGPSGKGVEIHTAVDASGTPFLNVLSYNPGTNSLDQKANFPFAWNDGLPHTINLFTSKGSGVCVLLVDGTVLGTFSYTTLNPGFSGPSISFGSGGAAVANGDLRTAMSVTDWTSVAVFKDSKISDPAASSRRYIGIYGGGDPSLLSSYYIHQIDWTVPHLYRIVRDPSTAVSVYVDGASVPSISVSYDSLTLPPSSSSFLKDITDSKQVVAFGGFNAFEISRTIWGPIKYSLGKMTITDRRVPPHQVLSQGNAFASPEHLRTSVAHKHAGFRVYSGGTPLDEFMYDSSIEAFTQLGEGTAPVPMTQDLESRGGLVKTAIQTSTADALAFVNKKGYISNLTDDTYNVVDEESAVDHFVRAAAATVAAFNAHLISPGAHASDDLVNTVTVPPIVTLADACAAMNAVAAAYNLHRVQPGVHVVDDTLFPVTSPLASNAQSLMDLGNDFTSNFHNHVERVVPHVTPDILNTVLSPNAVDLATMITLANDVAARYSAHRTYPGAHVVNDTVNVVAVPLCFDLPTAIALLNDIKGKFNAHLQYVWMPSSIGSHQGVDRFNEVVAPDATDLSSSIVLANALKTAFNAHLSQTDSHAAFDLAADSYSFATHYISSGSQHWTLYPSDVLSDCVLLANALKAAFNAHVVQRMVHVSNDEKNAVAVPNSSDLPTTIALANLIKTRYNSHREAVSSDSGASVHVNNDTVNPVTAVDASDLSSLVELLEDERSAYNLHRVEPDVHGSTVFIKLDPPPRVLYEGTKFFKFESGAEGLAEPFYDAGGPAMGPMSASAIHTLSYEGGSMPELANLVGVLEEPFSISAGDTMVVEIGSSSYTVTFLGGDVTAALVAARINATSGIPAGFASDNGDGRLRLTAPSAGVKIRASGIAAVKLGIDTAQAVSWFIVSDDPASVTAVLISGPSDFLRYGTISPGTRTAYMANTGLTDAPSLDYEATFKVRINSATLDSNGDTGVYVGVGGSSGPGYTAAIGFDYIDGVRYVKIQDLNAGVAVFRRAFDWNDGNFHTYKLVKRTATNSLSLVIVN